MVALIILAVLAALVGLVSLSQATLGLRGEEIEAEPSL